MLRAISGKSSERQELQRLIATRASMALVSSLCDGCQSLTNTVLDPNPVYLTEDGEVRSKNISVHKNFADLAQCAKGECALCLLDHREFYYHSWHGAIYRFPEELLDASRCGIG
jgi:hypothetical protein